MKVRHTLIGKKKLVIFLAMLMLQLAAATALAGPIATPPKLM